MSKKDGVSSLTKLYYANFCYSRADFMALTATHSFFSTAISALKQALAGARKDVRVDWVPVVLSDAEFVEELNSRLRQHPMYRPGMAFQLLAVGGSDSAEHRFAHTGPDGSARIYKEVLAEVTRDFELQDATQAW
jgi:hypothetical protein